MIDKKAYVSYFTYLDYLRETGVTNMFGARPYLEEEFDLSKKESSVILGQWMATYDENLSVEERIDNV